MQKGFTILFSLLVISLLMGTALSMSSLTQKRLILSSIGKQSQIAFYAADTGAECARYWDVNFNSFSTSTDVNTIICNGNSFYVGGPVEEGETELISEFEYEIRSPSATTPIYTYCTHVVVHKDLDVGQTTIMSRGYNTDCTSDSSRKVERAILVNY